MLAHAHAVDTRPSLRIIEGLGTRLIRYTIVDSREKLHVYIIYGLSEILKFLALLQGRQQTFSCRLQRRKHKTQTNQRTRDTRKILNTSMTYLIYRSSSDHHHRTIIVLVYSQIASIQNFRISYFNVTSSGSIVGGSRRRRR